MRHLVSILMLCMVFFSCKTENLKAGKNVEIYLLKSYKLISGKCQVDASASVIQDTSIISNQDILSYTPTTYEYKLTSTAFQKINSLKPRTPFAVTLDREVIFFGIYVPPYISSSCDHSIIMSPGWGADKISLQLGYPWMMQGLTIEDKRNDSRLIAALRKQGKLR